MKQLFNKYINPIGCTSKQIKINTIKNFLTLEDIIKQNGGEVWAIKKELDILLIGSGAKQHKIEKAKSLGANVITEEEFLILIE